MTTAVDHWRKALQRMAGADQRADPARAADLVAAHRHQVRAQFLHVERQTARHLGGVAVEQRPCGPCPLGDLAHRVEHAGLAVGCHCRHQRHVGSEQVLDGVRFDEAACGHTDHVQLH